jgi:HNH endonuclease
MSITHIPVELRRLVVARAQRMCEYCLIHEDDTFFGCEADHIVNEKHGGLTIAENLAYACLACNRNKGTDLGSIWEPSDALIRFFNPRVDVWSDHFSLKETLIRPITPTGSVTERIFRLNDIERLLEREALRALGRYPIIEPSRRPAL